MLSALFSSYPLRLPRFYTFRFILRRPFFSGPWIATLFHFSKRTMVHSTELRGLGMFTCRLLAGLMPDDILCPGLARHVTEVFVNVARSDDATYEYDKPRLCSRDVLFFHHVDRWFYALPVSCIRTRDQALSAKHIENVLCFSP